MGVTTKGENIMLNALKNVNPTSYITHASLHSASPGETEANEISGGSPAYARKAITWTSSTASDLIMIENPEFDVEAGDEVTHVGFYDASTNGNCLAWALVTTETFGAQGTYTLTDANIELS